MTAPRYVAIILAGDRGPTDPIAQATGAPCKALSPVGGVPLLWRVITTLQKLPELSEILLVGPTQEILNANPDLLQKLEASDITWIAPGASPSASAAKALTRLPDDQPALITTADHALLQPDMVTALLSGSRGHDLALAMVPYQIVHAAFPESRRTALRLRPGDGFCGCNLFAVNNTNGRRLITMWQQVEAQRKHPARMIIGMLGLAAVIRYGLRRLTLRDAFARLSARVGVDVHPVLLDDPTAAVDVDSVDDLRLVESILAASRTC